MASGISRYTALLIKYGTIGDDITLDVTGPVDGKYGYWITFWKNSRPHISPLISVKPHYDTREQAQQAMQKLVDEIKAIEDI